MSRIYNSPQVITLDELNARPSVITTAGISSNGLFQLTGSGPHGAAYRVLAGGDPFISRSNWVTINNGTLTGGVFTSSDSNTVTNHSKRFYQIVSP